MRRRALIASLVAAAGVAGCGSKSGPDFRQRTPPPYVGAYPVAPTGQQIVDRTVSKGDVERLRPVVAAWADAVRRRDAAGAARFFDLPAIVYQPDRGALEVRTPRIAEAFNAHLPCGARLLGTNADGRYVVGTFVLVEVEGQPCPGEGDVSRVGFVFGDRRHPRRFTEWWQVKDGASAETGPPARPKVTQPATMADFG